MYSVWSFYMFFFSQVYLKGSHRNKSVKDDAVFVNPNEGDLAEYTEQVATILSATLDSQRVCCIVSLTDSLRIFIQIIVSVVDFLLPVLLSFPNICTLRIARLRSTCTRGT